MPKLAKGSQLEYLARIAFSDYEILQLGPLPTSLASYRPGQPRTLPDPRHVEFARWCDVHLALPVEDVEQLVNVARAEDLERARFTAQVNEVLVEANEKFGRNINWNVWTNIPHLALWEAVALAVGINPKSIRELPVTQGRRTDASPALSFPWLTDKNAAGNFLEVLATAERAVTLEGPIVPVSVVTSDRPISRASVRLVDVARFLCACQLSGLSAEIQALAYQHGEERAAPKRDISPASSEALTSAPETPKQRWHRLLTAFETEEAEGGTVGALQRVFEAEKLVRPTADRSNIAKDIKKARAARDAERRGESFMTLTRHTPKVPGRRR